LSHEVVGTDRLDNLGQCPGSLVGSRASSLWAYNEPEVETDGRGGAAHQKGQSQIQISRYITGLIMLYTGVAGEKVRADYDLHI
jgi:hypothetical protein